MLLHAFLGNEANIHPARPSPAPMGAWPLLIVAPQGVLTLKHIMLD
jgi:hypothetical protein